MRALVRWAAVAVPVVAFGAALAVGANSRHVADADDLARGMRGKQVYAARCASCHGRALQGQPLWRVVDANQPRRAPALDGTGPGWRRSEAELLGAVRDGHFSDAAFNLRSRMPAFGATLPDSDIRAVLTFVQGRWPVAMRVAQAALTPGGSPPRDATGDWRFPPDCRKP